MRWQILYRAPEDVPIEEGKILLLNHQRPPSPQREARRPVSLTIRLGESPVAAVRESDDEED